MLHIGVSFRKMVETRILPYSWEHLNEGIFMQAWVWLIAAGILMGIEIMTADLLFASLAVAAVAAAAAAMFTDNGLIQGAIFAFFAIVSLAFLRPIALRNLRRQTKEQATNIDALIGADALVMEAVNSRSGQVKIRGEVWSAKSSGEDLVVDEIAEVVSIDGATAIVQRKGHND
jgi:membrane protein implicated in regulation of membrane protease activity